MVATEKASLYCRFKNRRESGPVMIGRHTSDIDRLGAFSPDSSGFKRHPFFNGFIGEARLQSPFDPAISDLETVE